MRSPIGVMSCSQTQPGSSSVGKKGSPGSAGEARPRVGLNSQGWAAVAPPLTGAAICGCRAVGKARQVGRRLAAHGLAAPCLAASPPHHRRQHGRQIMLSAASMDMDEQLSTRTSTTAPLAPRVGLILCRLLPHPRRPRPLRPSKPHHGRQWPLSARLEAHSLYSGTATRFACLASHHLQQS